MTEKDFIRKSVHSDFNCTTYTPAIIKAETNCYALAIGSAYPCKKMYRIGAICGCKPIEQDFFSIDEVKELLEKDLNILTLEYKEINNNAKDSKSFLENLQKLKLKSNQYIIVLFVKQYSDGRIWDFHFWRLDTENKIFIEKRFYHPVTQVNTEFWREHWNEKLVTAYIITK